MIVGGVRDTGSERTCGYGTGLDIPECGEPGTWHFIDHQNNWALTACDRHLDYLLASPSATLAMHPMGQWCGVPGSFWYTMWEDEVDGESSLCYMSQERPSGRTPAAVEAWLAAEPALEVVIAP